MDEGLEAVTAIADQPPPQPTSGPSILTLVRQDLVERERVGIERYGVPLQAHNGRDALVDAYQEALDLAAYLRQALAERDTPAPARVDGAHDRRTRAAALREAADRIDPGPRRPGVDTGFDRGVLAGQRGAATKLRAMAQLAEEGPDHG